jgi:CheY-like chemotaxis protein
MNGPAREPSMTDGPPPEHDRAVAAETGLDASRTRRAFLAHMRHELRTPINAMIGYSEMLLEDAADRGQDDFLPDLRKIHAAATQLLALVNDILDPAKLEASPLAMDLDAFGANLRHELRTPINAVIGYSEMLLEDAADRGQDDFLPDLEKIHASAQRFLEIINDLVTFSQGRSGGFDLAQQASDTSAMIQGVVTTIRPLEEEPGGPARDDRGSILIVDDNEINRDVLSRQLERQGHLVTAAEHGRRALEVLASQKVDLVLLDIMMPEINGYQVLQRLKGDPALRDIPVIMISALDEIDSVVRCVEMGAEDYLPKPFNPVLLKARIGACLEKKRLRDQEVEYLRHVAQVTTAASAVEAGAFQPETLAEVAGRGDGLGQLARVFQRMGREVQAREQRLRQQVQALRIEIDQVKRARQVAEITDTDYFQQLQERARKLRSRQPHPPTPPSPARGSGQGEGGG